jgi:hypothetical protein
VPGHSDRCALTGAVHRGKPPHPVGHQSCRYLPDANALEFWTSLRRVDEASAVCDWLVSKRIDPVAAADADRVRALQPGAATPPWASHWGILQLRLAQARSRSASVTSRPLAPFSAPSWGR